MKCEVLNEPQYVLTLNREEAEWMLAIGENIGGEDKKGHPRSVICGIAHALRANGVETSKHVKWRQPGNYAYVDKA